MSCYNIEMYTKLVSQDPFEHGISVSRRAENGKSRGERGRARRTLPRQCCRPVVLALGAGLLPAIACHAWLLSPNVLVLMLTSPFHTLLAEATGNPVLILMMRLLMDLLRQVNRPISAEDTADVILSR